MLPTLSPQEFVKWRSATLKERSAAQEHFHVCRLVGQQTPANLYDQRPTWLDMAHRKLDEAVVDAYDWPRGR
jgi:hypothetical protein